MRLGMHMARVATPGAATVLMPPCTSFYLHRVDGASTFFTPSITAIKPPLPSAVWFSIGMAIFGGQRITVVSKTVTIRSFLTPAEFYTNCCPLHLVGQKTPCS